MRGTVYYFTIPHSTKKNEIYRLQKYKLDSLSLCPKMADGSLEADDPECTIPTGAQRRQRRR